MKTILINVNSTVLPKFGNNVGYISGVGRSTICLLSAMSQIYDPDIRIRTCLESTRYLGMGNNDTLCDKFVNRWNPLPLKYSYIYRKLFMQYDLYHYPDNFYSYHYEGEKYLLTIHDTIMHEEALKCHDTEKINFALNNVKNSAGIVTCSEYSKQRILDFFPVSPDKIEVIPWGINRQRFRIKATEEIKTTLESFQISPSYFLAVSCREERKNMRNLLKAYRLYLQKGSAQLVLIWGNPPSDILKEYSKEISDSKIVFLNYVSDSELVDLYNGAICTLFPSKYEGFGFPIIESYACGTPVMTCRNSSLKEVGGDFAYYVGEDDIMQMSETMCYANSQNKLSFQDKIEGYVSGFSWEKTARKYLDLYKKLV